MARTVKAGDDIRKGITATSIYEQNKKRIKARPNTIEPFSETSIIVKCKASAGVELVRFEAANIVGPAVPYSPFGTSSFQYSTLFTEVNDTLTADKWGIVQGPCLPNITSKLVVSGVTWALFNYTSGHTHVDVVSGALTSGTSGKAIILSPPESPGLPGLILIRGGINIESPFFVLTGNMAPVSGSWATARAMANFCDWDNNILFSDYIYSWLGIIDDEQTGFKGTAEYFKGRWRFEQGPCDQGEG